MNYVQLNFLIPARMVARLLLNSLFRNSKKCLREPKAVMQMDLNLAVTTVYDPDPDTLEAAHSWAKKLNTRFVPRERKSIATIMNTAQANIILLASKEGPIVHTPGGKYFFI